jgi:hypothetical protein
MKPKGRRRKDAEIIPRIEGCMYDRARDIYVKWPLLPIMKLTPEQRESIGEFASLRAPYGDPTHPVVFKQITESLTRPRELLPWIRVLMQARNVFAILVSYCYSYQHFVEHFDRGLDKIARARRDH